MRNILWQEIADIKFGYNYLQAYLDKEKRKVRYFKIFTLVFSTAGVLGWKFWELMPLIACFIICFIQIVNLIKSEIISDDKTIVKIAKLKELYNDYYLVLEKLWNQIEGGDINEKELSVKYYKLTFKNRIEKLDNELEIRQYSKLIDIINIDTLNELKKFEK